MIDFDFKDNLKKYNKAMQIISSEGQKKFSAFTRSQFLPRTILFDSGGEKAEIRLDKGSTEEIAHFEAVWIFEMVGRNFE